MFFCNILPIYCTRASSSILLPETNSSELIDIFATGNIDNTIWENWSSEYEIITDIPHVRDAILVWGKIRIT